MMTTPEALKQRQVRILKWLRIESMVLGLVMVVLGVQEYNDGREDARQHEQDRRQDACMAEQIAKISEAFNARGVLLQQEFENLAKELGAEVPTVFEPLPGTPAVKKPQRVPDFPTGKCEDG